MLKSHGKGWSRKDCGTVTKMAKKLKYTKLFSCLCMI